MALETLLIKVKSTLDSVHPKLLKSPSRRRLSAVGVLAFEIAAVISKLLHLSQSLSDSNLHRLRHDLLSLHGVRKLVSDDDSFLLSLAAAELSASLRSIAAAVSRLSLKCHDSNLRSFDPIFRRFADSGRDPNGWVLSNPKEIEANHRKMERYVTLTASLHKEMEELAVLENGFKKSLHHHHHQDQKKAYELQQKIFWQKQQIKDLKERSLWNRSFDSIVSLLVRSVFTVVARIKLVFVIGTTNSVIPSSLSRSLSASAVVYPSESDHHHHHQTHNHNPPPSSSSSSPCTLFSGPLLMRNSKPEDNSSQKKNSISTSGFFESTCNLLNPPPSTLGAAALALHYANLIIVMEKMIKSPQLVGIDARDDLYAMLPNSIRSSLRARLKGVGFCASDSVLAAEWREALGRILGWLSPLAHNMIKWQSERSFEQQNLVPKITNVMLLQTLFFANKDKTEAAITELLVGLNYIWRFEREMTAKALFQCANLNVGLLNNLQKPC